MNSLDSAGWLRHTLPGYVARLTLNTRTALSKRYRANGLTLLPDARPMLLPCGLLGLEWALADSDHYQPISQGARSACWNAVRNGEQRKWSLRSATCTQSATIPSKTPTIVQGRSSFPYPLRSGQTLARCTSTHTSREGRTCNCDIHRPTRDFIKTSSSIETP